MGHFNIAFIGWHTEYPAILTPVLSTTNMAFFDNPFDIQPFWPAVSVSLVIVALMSFMTKEKESPDYYSYYEKIQSIPDTVL